MLEIKKATPNDWNKIQLIAHKTWWQSYGEILPKEQLEYMLDLIYSESALIEQMIVKKHEFILVFEGDIPLGFASYESNSGPLPELMIHKLYILPQMQGKGVGKNIMDYVTEIAIQNANNKLRLKVFHKNSKAIEFYQKCGFYKIATETTSTGNGYSILDNVMIKHIERHVQKQ